MFTISIGKAEATCADKITLTSGMVKAVRVAFIFSEEWENFDKIVVFSNGAETLDVSLGEDNTCYIPHEMMADAGRDVTCGVYGYKGEGSKRVAIPTVKCSLGKVVEGVNPSGDEPKEPTPTVWEKFEKQLNTLSENKADKSNVYTKSETDSKISDIIVQEPGEDATKVMSQKFLTELLMAMSDGFEYSLGELENEMRVGLDSKVDANRVYGKSEVYTKEETDLKIDSEVGYMGMGFDERCSNIEAQIGNIDSALDELHNYAQALIGGNA